MLVSEKHTSLPKAILGYIAGATTIVVTAPYMAEAAGELADLTGLGGTFFGTTMVALCTSLPELVATVVSVRMGAFDLALGNIFGSNTFNMILLVPLDIASSGSLMAGVSQTHALTAFATILVTAVAVMGQLYHVEKRKRFVEPDAVTVISGGRCGHTRNHARRLLLSALSELGDHAARAGVMLALHPMNARFAEDWTFLNTLDETLAILDHCRHPAVGIHFDAFHLCREARLLDRIGEIAAQTAVVQFSDWDGTARTATSRSLPGDGILPLAEMMQAFATGGYAGHFEISVWSEEVWRSDYEAVLIDCVHRYRQMAGSNVPSPASSY